MITTEIARQGWIDFLDDFSNQHEGEFASIECIGDDIGDQLQGKHLPLTGVSAEKSGDNTVTFMFGCDSEEYLEHRVYRAQCLRLKTGQGGMEDTLEVESADHVKTILQILPRYALQ